MKLNTTTKQKTKKCFSLKHTSTEKGSNIIRIFGVYTQEHWKEFGEKLKMSVSQTAK